MGRAKEVSYYTVGNIVTLFFQWLIIMLIPKFADFTEAGIFAVAVSVSSITNQIATFTLNQHQVANQNTVYSENDYAVARVATVMLSFLCIFPVSLLFGYGMSQILIIIAYTGYRNLINYGYLHMSALQIAGRLDYAGKCMVLEGIVSFSVFAGTYAVTDSLVVSTLLMAVIGGGCFLLSIGEGYRRTNGRRYGLDPKDRGNLKALLLIGVPLLVSTLCPIVITAVPKLFLETWWGQTVVGYFGTLTSPTIVVPTIATSVFAPFIVYFSGLCREGDMRRLRIGFAEISAVLLAAGAVFYVLSMFLAEPVFAAVYGSDIEPYVGYFGILVGGIFFYSIGMCGITVLITKNQGKAAGIASFAAMVVSVAIFLIVIPSDGMSGATWGLMAAYGIFGLLISLCVWFLPLDNQACSRT